MPQEFEEDIGRALAQWLQEAARRVHPPSSQIPPATAVEESAPAARKGLWERIRWPALLGLVTIAFLQYFFAATELDILRLPRVLVFVMVNGRLPF